LSLDELRDRLDEAGIEERDSDRGEVDVDTKAAVLAWEWADDDCRYMAATIAAWASDPIRERHPWLMNKAIKLACAHRNGCLTQDLWREGASTLEGRLRDARAADGSDRRERGEFHRTMRDAITNVASFTDEKVLSELKHLHDEQLAGGNAATESVSHLSHLSQSPDTRSSESCLPSNQVRHRRHRRADRAV
jgi:hypothetical protein